MKTILVHYAEIALKGNNRKYFENKLIKNIKAHLQPVGHFKIQKLHDRLLLELHELHETLEPHERSSDSRISSILQQIPGIANFAFAHSTKLDLKEIKKQALTLAKKQKFKTFAIRAERANKKFRLTSPEIEKQIGAHILKNFKATTDRPSGLSRHSATKSKTSPQPIKVNLTNPDLTIHIEILENQTLIYTKKTKGLSGLPTSSSGKVISLISGGIDSPVASYMLIKRGCRVVFTHFHSYPQTSQESINQVKKLIEILNQYQLNSKLYLIPLLDIQKQIVANCPQKLRIILYRRMMIRLANQIAEKENAKALVTGDAIGQVASQTLENIQAISESSKLPILRPLAGFNKQEIIDLAKKIKTYQTSIQPFGDCCSLFNPTHPETKAKLDEVLKSEKELDINELINNALENLKVSNF